MECFRVDESGYTGFDLFNSDQRFQGASAIAISDDDAAHLIKEHFPRMQADELKYSSLSRRAANHERILSLQRELLSSYKCVTYVCDKRYLLALMFLDYAVEPFYYEKGFDFYENGQNYAMASLFYMTGPTFFGQSSFDNILVSFQRAIKSKKAQDLDALVAAIRATNWRELPEILGPLAEFHAPECLSAITTSGVNTDAAPVVLQSLISRMEVLADGPYRVEHDQSENLHTFHGLLQQFIDHDSDIEFYQSEVASLKFPLKLQDVSQVDSKQSAAVQLADVTIGAAIGATNTMTGQRSKGVDPESLMRLYSEDQFIHLIPSLDFAGQRRFREGSQSSELIDYFSRVFSSSN